MKPNKTLIKAIQNYCHNCSLQAIEPWDKEADLEKIFAASKEQGFIQTTACAGTFIFSYKTPSGKVKAIVTDSKKFPQFVKWEDYFNESN